MIEQKTLEDFADVINYVAKSNRQVAIEKDLPDSVSKYIRWCISPNNALCCLAPFIYTWAILDGVDRTGYARRWCYGSLTDAAVAQLEWLREGGDAPKNFIRAV